MSYRSRSNGSHYPITRRTYRQHGSGRKQTYTRTSGTLTTEQRNRLPDSDFAVILKSGERKYPIENVAHGRDALARVSANGSPEEKAEVRRKVHERYPSIDH